MSSVAKNTITRILTAAIALPVYVFAFTTDRWLNIPILAASAIISLACLYEYYRVSSVDATKRPFMAAGLVAGLGVNLVMYFYALHAQPGYYAWARPFMDARIIIALVAVLIGVIAAAQLFRRPIQNGIYSLAVTVFGVVFIALFFSHIILIKAVPDGVFHIFFINIVVMLNDTGAYFSGVLLGKHKTNFPVSPNKSWEGYAGGFLVSVLSAAATVLIFRSCFGVALFGVLEAMLIGAALSVTGNLGDLIESAVKRDGSIKDSGSIIPGHGGMWDAFDALVFSMPFYYYYLIVRGLS